MRFGVSRWRRGRMVSGSIQKTTSARARRIRLAARNDIRIYFAGLGVCGTAWGDLGLSCAIKECATPPRRSGAQAGAPEFFSRGFPGLTAWAKLWRTYGASERVRTGQQADLKKSPAMVRGRYVRQIREKMRPSAWAR